MSTSSIQVLPTFIRDFPEIQGCSLQNIYKSLKIIIQYYMHSSVCSCLQYLYYVVKFQCMLMKMYMMSANQRALGLNHRSKNIHTIRFRINAKKVSSLLHITIG